MSSSRLVLALTFVLAAFLAAVAASSAAAASCNQTIFDGGGYIFDFEAFPLHPGGDPDISDIYAAVRDGGSKGPEDSPTGPVKSQNAYDDWGNVSVFLPSTEISEPTVADHYAGPVDACEFDLGGQEIAYPVLPMHGLEVQHRWFVDPGKLHGARILTVLHNPGGPAVKVTVVQGDPTGETNLGANTGTIARASSDGSGNFTPASIWGVSADRFEAKVNGDPALAHVWDGPGGAASISEVVLGESFRGDELYWAWRGVSVAPGATVAFVSYEIQSAVPGRDSKSEVAGAVSRARAREHQSFASLYEGMSAAEIAGTLNWAHPPVSARIAPVGAANAAHSVLLDGSASEAAVEGLPQCAPTFSWTEAGRVIGNTAVTSHAFAPGAHSVALAVTNSCGGAQTVETSFKVAPAFRLGKVGLNRKAGTASLRVSVAGPGRLTLAGKGVARTVKRVKRAGTVSLTVKPSGQTSQRLEKTGSARVKVNVVLRPTGGFLTTQSKSISLKLRR